MTRGQCAAGQARSSKP